MSATTWYWPVSGAAARGISLAPYDSGLFVSDWRNDTLWPFLQASSGSVALSGGNSPLNLGLVAIASDGASGSWALGWTGTLWHVASGLFITSGALPSGIYGDVATVSGIPYSLSVASGQVYASGGTLLGSFGRYIFNLQASGSTLYGLATGSIGTMTVPGGVTGSIALPPAITTPATLWGASGYPLLLGGWANAPTLAGAIAFGFDPATSTQMLGVGSGIATLWSLAATGTDQWNFSQAVTGGISNLSAVAWVPNGTQALAVDTNNIQVLQYVTNVLSLAQTLALPNVGAIATFATSKDALACCPASNQVTPLTAAASVWSVSGSSLTLAGAAAIAATGPLTASVGFTSGVATLTQIGGIWSITATGALGFTPTTATADRQGLAYFTGPSGAAGAYAVCSGVQVLASGIVASGVPSATVVDQGRWVMGVPAVSGLITYGLTAPNTWTQRYVTTVGSGAVVGVGVAGQTLFAGTAAQTVLFNFIGAPIHQPQRVVTGLVGAWNGSAWVTGGLGVGNRPAALVGNGPGSMLAVCTNNSWFALSSVSGTVLASGVVPQYPTQIAGTPMGMSALLSLGASIYAATSMPGVLAVLSFNFWDNGGFLILFSALNWSTNGIGVPPGGVWSNSLFVSVVGGITPNPSAPPVFFGTITAAGLLALGGGDLPLSDPHVVYQLWNNGGFICVSAG